MKNVQILSLSIACIIFLFSHSANAEIYKWIDEHGNAHFTDSPPANKKSEEVILKINTYSAVQIKPLLERLGRKDKVVIYSTSWCRICKQAKKYFRDNSIAYVEYDVEKSPSGKRDYKLLRGKAVPIIIVGDKRMNGFSASKFEKFYQQQMAQQTTEDES